MSAIDHRLIDSHLSSLSFKEKKEGKDLIFQTFELFSNFPTEEILGRNYWIDIDPNENRKIFVIGMSDYINSKCGITYNAILSALLGNDLLKNEKTNKSNITCQNAEINSFKELIEKNRLNLVSADNSEFFAYGFELSDIHIYSRTSSNTYGGHAFVVIQYLDDQNQVRYRMFQSYVMRYSLQEYLNSKKGDFNEEEFEEFLTGLKDLNTATKWSLEMQNFYQKFFDVTHKYEENSSFSSKIQLEIKWGAISLKAFSEYKKNYEHYKGSEKFPKLVSIPANEESKLSKIERFLKTKTDKQIPVTALCMILFHDQSIEMTSTRAQLFDALIMRSFEIEDLESFFHDNPQLQEFDASFGKIKRLPLNLPPSLKIARLKNLDIQNQDLRTLFEKCPHLQELDLSFCENITELPSKLPPSLKIIRLSSTKIKNEDIDRLFAQCPNLKEVDFARCPNLTKLPEHLPPSLTKVKISKTQIGSKDLERILEQCFDIKKIFAVQCKNINTLPDRFPTSLKKLSLDETFSDQKIAELGKAYPEICFES